MAAAIFSSTAWPSRSTKNTYSQSDAAVARALTGLREKAPFVKILGSYPAAL